MRPDCPRCEMLDWLVGMRWRRRLYWAVVVSWKVGAVVPHTCRLKYVRGRWHGGCA